MQTKSPVEPSTRTVPPSGVNFKALLSRLYRICLNRTRSAYREKVSSACSMRIFLSMVSVTRKGFFCVFWANLFEHRERAYYRYYFWQRLGNAEGFPSEFKQSRFDLRQVQNVIDQLQQVARAIPHVSHKTLLLICEI